MSSIWDFTTAHPIASVSAASCSAMLYLYFQRPKLDHIPTVGSTGLKSWIEGYKALYHAKDIIQDGYYRFRGNAFKYALPGRWQVILTTPELVDELRLAKDQDLSFYKAVAERLQTEFTMGKGLENNMYHVPAVRSQMTRSLGIKFPEIYDEVVQSFNDLIPANDKEWMAVNALSTIQNIVCRTSNRLFLGLPICREPEWVDLNIRFTIEAFGSAAIINMFPTFLKPLVGHYLSPTKKAVQLGRKYLAAEIEQRLRMDNDFGKAYEGRPNDMISWLLDIAPQDERTCDKLILRLLLINIAAIHTSANSFTQALFNLAAYPEHVAPMREEVLSIVAKEGWTKAALGKMKMVDSFLKETARFDGLDGVLLERRVVNPAGFTFSNGLYLPYGTLVSAPSFAIHHDPRNYEDPFTFDGFRFSKQCDDDGQNLKQQMIATSLEYLNFGHGRTACPGRFFAANELKIMLAHILVTYDVVLDGDVKPGNPWFGSSILPDSKAKVLFKRRMEA